MVEWRGDGKEQRGKIREMWGMMRRRKRTKVFEVRGDGKEKMLKVEEKGENKYG